MKKSKNVWILTAVVTGVFIALFFAIPFPKNVVAWVAFIFEMIALAAQPYFLSKAFRNGTELKSKVYGFPVFKVGCTYLAAQSAITLLCIIVGCFVGNELWWLPFVLSTLAVAYGTVGLIVTDSTRNIIEDIDRTVTVDTAFIDTLKADTTVIRGLCAGTEAAKAAERLCDDARFSDPVSNASLKALEDQIASEVYELKASLMSGGSVEATDKIEHITLLLGERNTKTKIMK